MISGSHMRRPQEISAFESRLANVNRRLEALGEPTIQREELIAARLYTGPTYVK